MGQDGAVIAVRRLGIFAPGPVRPLAVSHALGAVADALVTISLAGSLVFNLSPDASRTQVLLYLAVTMVPFTVLAPFVGPAVDRSRYGHRLLAVVLFVLRALCALGMALTLFQLTLYPIAFVLLMANKASSVVRQAIIPRLVDDPALLVRTNSAFARVSAVAAGLGGGAGAALLSLSGDGRVPLVVGSVVFAAGAMVALQLPAARTGAPPPAEIEYVELHTPSIVVASSGMMALRAGVGYFVFLLAFALRRENEPAWVFAAAMAAYGVGTFLATIVATVLSRRFREERLMALAMALATAAAVLGVIGVNLRALLVASFTIGLAASLGRQVFDSLLQRAAPDALRGRAFARFETRFQLTWVIGGLLASAFVLPTETGMILLALIFAPVLGLYVRGAADALRFEPQPGPNELAPAQARLHAAEGWEQIGNGRHAVIDAAAAADLAVVSGSESDPDVLARLAELRRLALDRDVPESAIPIHEAIELARRVVGITPSV